MYNGNRNTCIPVPDSDILHNDYDSFSFATRFVAPYLSRSAGFSIFPVAFLGTSAKITLRGRLYRGSSRQKLLISSSVASAPANTAVIIEADEDDYDVTTALSPADVTGNLLKASDGFVAGDGTTIYALGNKSGVGFYLVKSGVKVPVGKAYLTVSGSGVKEFLPFDFNEADGISLTPALSEGEGAIYNLAGQRLSKMQKGINIINGKKVLR